MHHLLLTYVQWTLQIPLSHWRGPSPERHSWMNPLWKWPICATWGRKTFLIKTGLTGRTTNTSPADSYKHENNWNWQLMIYFLWNKLLNWAENPSSFWETEQIKEVCAFFNLYKANELDLPVKKRRKRRPEIASCEEMSIKLSPVQEVFLSTFILCHGQSLPTAQRTWFIQPKHVWSPTQSLLPDWDSGFCRGPLWAPHCSQHPSHSQQQPTLCVWVCVRDTDSDTVWVSFFSAPPCWIHTNKDSDLSNDPKFECREVTGNNLW